MKNTNNHALDTENFAVMSISHEKRLNQTQKELKNAKK